MASTSRKLKKIAVTGGLACGKSSVCQIFKELGAEVVSADQIVHYLLHPTSSEGRAVIKLLGSDVVINGEIDRTQIAERVFTNPALLEDLEAILHPVVKCEIERLYQQAAASPSTTYFVVEVPLLFEKDWHEEFDVTVAVIADESQCRERYLHKGGKVDDFERRWQQQLTLEEKAERADFVIMNHTTIADLKEQTQNLATRLK